MYSISLKTNIALIAVISTILSGCTTKLGYVKDHPDPDISTNYKLVQEWAYDVSDGYSSRGTMNRYSIYWGGALAAGGAGALGGLAATGGTGHANIIIPLTGAFIGTLFGYYQNEQLAQLYFAASDTIKTLIVKSEKRQLASPKEIEIWKNILITENENLSKKETENKLSRERLNTYSNALKDLSNASPDKKLDSKISKALAELKKLPEETDTTINNAKDESDSKIADTQNKLAVVENRLHNLSLLDSSLNHTLHEVHCLTDDVNAVMHKVQIHLAQLDPKNVSEDLKKINSTDNAKDSKMLKPSSENDATKPSTSSPTEFDLSDLDPKKIASVCEIEL